MRIKHTNPLTHYHDVYVVDDGTLDTVLQIDGHEVRYSALERDPRTGVVLARALRQAAIDACDDGLLSEEDRDSSRLDD